MFGGAGSVILGPVEGGSGKTQWCRVFPLDGIGLYEMNSYPVHSPVHSLAFALIHIEVVYMGMCISRHLKS